ncbi:hypothetical protein [Microvirga sp. G4-2]|uniref:hypothetical protein n=1 Tax=Microvirga sp. G4-2 TaxID=3434467 RepID=UPI0040441AD1
MLEIDVSLDTIAFDASVDAYLKDDLLPALVDAIKDVAEMAEVRPVEAMGEGFDRPSPFTLGGVQFLPAHRGGSRGPAALISLMLRQAGYLDLQIRGIWPATRDAYGELPRGHVLKCCRIRMRFGCRLGIRSLVVQNARYRCKCRDPLGMVSELLQDFRRVGSAGNTFASTLQLPLIVAHSGPCFITNGPSTNPIALGHRLVERRTKLIIV